MNHHEAAEHHFACAMVNPAWVPTAYAALAGTGIPVGVVVGFPLGANLTSTKREEAAAVKKIIEQYCSSVITGPIVRRLLYPDSTRELEAQSLLVPQSIDRG